MGVREEVGWGRGGGEDTGLERGQEGGEKGVDIRGRGINNEKRD